MSYRAGDQFDIRVVIVRDDSFEDDSGNYHSQILVENDCGSRFFITDNNPILREPELI